MVQIQLQSARALYLAIILGAAGLLGCGTDTSTPRSVTIDHFEVSPDRLASGGDVTLHWETSGASSVRLHQGEEEIVLDGAAARGSITVAITASTTFTLTAYGAGGASVSASRAVTVDGPWIGAVTGPELVEANEEGEAVATIAWSGVMHTTSLSLHTPGREPVELDPELGDGSLEVRLREDTTFTLVAKNDIGEDSRSVSVRIAYLPSIERFEADRELIGFGESTQVHWETKDAIRLELWLNEVPLDGSLTPEGSREVLLVSSSTLELRAFNEMETMVSSTLQVEVGAPEVLDLQVSSSSLWLGETTTFTWQTKGGSELKISLDETGEIVCEEVELAKVGSSSCDWQPPAVGTYPITLTLSNSSGVAGEPLLIFAGSGPLITHFGASPTVLTEGDELELRWSVHSDPAGNEANLSLTDDRGNAYEIEGVSGLLHTTLQAAGPYELRLEATTDHPDSIPSVATIDLLVHARPYVEFAATPAHFDDSVADEVVISWTTSDAAAVVIYRIVDGSEVVFLEPLDAEREAGSFTLVPREDEHFRLVATNSIGGSRDQDLVVTVAPLEVLLVEADPPAFTQGQPVTLRWVSRMADEVTIENIGTKNYLLEETDAPYLDLEEFGGARLPLKQGCGGPVDTHGCAEITFPSTFHFPFDGDLHAGVRVFTPGYLSFSAPTSNPALPFNENFPTVSGMSEISLAPFWDELGWDMQRYPEGNIWTALIEENEEQIFVIQWRDVGYFKTNQRTASFNFEVILRQDGSFDFRYGIQSARDADLTAPIPGTLADYYTTAQMVGGASATIGFQLPSQSDFDVIAFNNQVPMNGSREHRTFSYRPLPTIPRVGELVFSPYGDQQNVPITVTATRDGESHSKTVILQIARRAQINLVPEEIAPAPMGEEFVLGWNTTNAQTLEIVDEDGNVRYTAPNQAAVEEGLVGLVEEEAGEHRYTVRTTGAHGFAVERHIVVQVYGGFGVASFEADEDSIEQGGDVLLRWEVFEASSVSIFADEDLIFTDPSGARFGSFLVEGVQQETDFKVVVSNEVGVTDEKHLTVGLWDILIGLQTSASSVRPGDPITIDIDARVRDGGAPLKVYGLLPLAEVPGPGDRYSNISGHPTAADLGITPGATSSVSDVVLPFPFPYMGMEYTQLRAFVDGYISFTSGATIHANNLPFPASVGQSVNVHLAPFWDDLQPHSVGKMHTAQLDDDSFVIQWSRMSAAAGSINASPWDLNFQLVLHRDGSFEYRYGTMEPHPTRRPPSGCFPNTCLNEANGSAATVGYQFVNETAGFNYHFGGSVPAPANLPITDGLSNRTLRYPATTGTGSFTFHPQRSETFTFCSIETGILRCKDLRIEAEFGLHAATLSKEEIAFGEAVTLSWKSTGGKVLNILDGETVVYTTSNLAEVDQGSTVLNPTRDGPYVVELVAGNRRARIQKLVEVNRVGITATATTSSGPGTPVTVSWNLTTTDPLQTPHLVTPMDPLSNSDFSSLDLTTQEGVTVLVGANSDFGRARLDFDDFSFPFFGTSYDHIQVFTDGYLGWDTVNSVPANVSIPNTTGLNHTKAIAPFWDDLHTWQNGRILAKKIDADRYVIQWSRMSFRWGATATNEADMNFLVVLHRDGSFEFRFGHMLPPLTPENAGGNSCAPITCENEANGSSATIGYQAPGGVAGYQVHFGGSNRALSNPIVAGGLSFQAWKFTPQTSAGAGSVQVHPVDSSLYRICTYDPPSKEVRCAPTLRVEVPWGIDLFQINPTSPLAGQPATLSWSVQNLDQLRILADGIELAWYSGPSIPLFGSLQITPLGPTTYTLEATSMGRTITKELRVEIRAFDLTVSAPQGRFFPGETVTVDWTLVNHTSEDIAMLTPMTELEIGPAGENAFVDISTIPDATELTLSGPVGSVPLNIPFPFPYLWGQHERLEIYATGYISFSAFNAWGTARHNFSLPTSIIFNDSVHMAVFWDDLIMRGGDSVWSYSPDPDTLIIQWKAFSRLEGSSAVERFNLNFQAVLRRDGSFDYRYGVMEPPQQPFSYSECAPNSCINEANGSSATIGYQITSRAQYAGLQANGGIYGANVHVGSLVGEFDFLVYQRGAVDGFLPFPDGLSHRSFRYTPAHSGSSRVVVGRTADQEVCAFALDFSECKTVRIDVVANSGELMITEMMIDPAAGVPGQWIEVRNLTQRTIDLEGFELRSNQGSHKIAGTLPVPPGEFVTLASSSQVPFTPSYVYGEAGGVPFNRLFDRIELLAGSSIISSVDWGAEWSVPYNETLSLDPSRHLTGIQDNSEFDRWCRAGSSGNPAAVGESCIDSWYAVDPLSSRPFIDISLSGDRFYEIEGQSLLARLPISGFPVKLYGQVYSRLWVSSSGWVSLSDLPVLPGQPLPPDFPRTVVDPQGPLIAPFWNLLRCMDQRCRVFYEQRSIDGEDALIIQWQDFIPGTAPSGGVTFQVQIWANGDLIVAFDHVDNPTHLGSMHAGPFEGSTAWIGLESADPSIYTTAHDRRRLGLDRRSIYFQAK